MDYRRAIEIPKARDPFAVVGSATARGNGRCETVFTLLLDVLETFQCQESREGGWLFFDLSLRWGGGGGGGSGSCFVDLGGLPKSRVGRNNVGSATSMGSGRAESGMSKKKNKVGTHNRSSIYPSTHIVTCSSS